MPWQQKRLHGELRGKARALAGVTTLLHQSGVKVSMTDLLALIPESALPPSL